MFVLNDYIFLSKRIESSEKLNPDDIIALQNSLDNIYDFYLDNYCKAFSAMDLNKRKNANLSEKLQQLSLKIMTEIRRRQTPTLDDEELILDK